MYGASGGENDGPSLILDVHDTCPSVEQTKLGGDVIWDVFAPPKTTAIATTWQKLQKLNKK